MNEEDKNYIVCFALVKRNGMRAMPIGGKTLKNANSPIEKAKASELVLELLLRINQSKNSELIKDKDINNIYIIKLSEEQMKKNLPKYKSIWIEGGDTNLLIKSITLISKEILTISYEKYAGINLTEIK